MHQISMYTALMRTAAGPTGGSLYAQNLRLRESPQQPAKPYNFDAESFHTRLPWKKCSFMEKKRLLCVFEPLWGA